MAGDPCVEDFQGFGVLVFHRALAWDAGSAIYIIEDLNGGNKLGLGMTPLDKLYRGNEPKLGILCNRYDVSLHHSARGVRYRLLRRQRVFIGQHTIAALVFDKFFFVFLTNQTLG